MEHSNEKYSLSLRCLQHAALGTLQLWRGLSSLSRCAPLRHGGAQWDEGGGISRRGGGKKDEDGDFQEEHQAQQGHAAADGGRLEHGQHDPGANVGDGGGGGGQAMSLQDLRAPSLLGSLWDLVGSLG